MNNDKKNLDIYLNDIATNTLLTDHEEQLLAQQVANGDTKAANKLVEANLRFVVAMARQYDGQGLSMDDLVAEGNVGMLKAANRLKAGGGKRFVTFAAPYIRKAIETALDEQNSLCKIPRDEAERTGLKHSKTVSVDAPIPAGSQNNFSLLSVLENTDSPQADAQVEQEGMADSLKTRIDRLDERERSVITAFYGIGTAPLTMAEIAADMGLKRERVRQIRDKALRKLKRK